VGSSCSLGFIDIIIIYLIHLPDERTPSRLPYQVARTTDIPPISYRNSNRHANTQTHKRGTMASVEEERKKAAESLSKMLSKGGHSKPRNFREGLGAGGECIVVVNIGRTVYVLYVCAVALLFL